MKNFVFYSFLILLLFSCQDIVEVTRPENLIEREKMEEIIYDIALMNSARGFNVQKLKRNNVSPERYVFDKHNIDSLQYAQSTVYYASDSEDYKIMYQNVQKRIDDIYEVLKEEEKVFQKQKDSIRTAEVKARRKRDSINRTKGDTLNTPKGPRQRPSLSSSSQI
tara:strand:+ start:3132 stop:3626 length:495 start_codon:yes stop_codon:yes gene_type:complete